MKTKALFPLNMKRAPLCFIVFFTLSSSLFTPCRAQVGINKSATSPDASAILDLQTGNTGVNKGFLPQAVALTATNEASPVASPATGLIVYNTATAGNAPYNVVPGYYYWNSSAWASLGASLAPVIYGGLNNSSATVGTAATALGTGTYNFIKQYSSTKVEVKLNSGMYSGSFSGASEIEYQIRMNGVPASISQVHWTFATATNEYVVLDAIFTGLAAGTYQIQIYAITNAGTSTGVYADMGGWGGSIIAQEEF